jgi:type VI secretion system ImpJ/VasE family protein
VRFPGNASIEARSFAEALDANKGYVEVFLGLPLISSEEPNTLRLDATPMGGQKYRYRSRMVSVNDLSDGGNPREIEVKGYNPRVLFSGESTFGYETIRIAAVSRSGQFGAIPKAEREHVPHCINVEASPFLTDIMREIGNRLIAKNRSLRAYWKSKDTAAMMKARDGFKVQTLATATNAFSLLAQTRPLHPFALYAQIAQIIGQLSIYCTDDALVAVPAYDHDRAGPAFKTVHENLVKLLALLEEQTYTARVFEISGELLVCPIEKPWFDDRHDLYLCLEAPLDETEVGKRVGGLKIASENVIPILNKRRIRGMAVEGPVHHMTHLPTSPNHHYFKIPRDTTYFPKLVDHPTLAIWGEHSFAELVTLFVVERNT